MHISIHHFKYLVSILLFSSIIFASTVIFNKQPEITHQNPISTSKITTKDNTILKDGKLFLARGVIFEGFLEPKEWLQECVRKEWQSHDFCGRHLDSRNYYFGLNNYTGKDALTLAINDWNINTIRLNISQTALDPTSQWYTPTYIEEIKELTQIARQRDLIVILALFSASNRNSPIQLQERNPYTPLNTSSTLNAAEILGKTFGQDENVMIELLNEPWSPVKKRTEGWKLLYQGGVAKNPKSKFNENKFIGNQEIINKLRRIGAKNPIIVQGLRASFDKVPSELQDPLNKIIYSVHPFFNEAEQNPELWNKKFGNFSESHPFMITAWNARERDSWCEISGSDTVSEFLDYLQQRNIGIIVYAFDVPYTITRNFQHEFETPSRSSNKCTKWGGAGEAIQEYFEEQK